MNSFAEPVLKWTASSCGTYLSIQDTTYFTHYVRWKLSSIVRKDWFYEAKTCSNPVLQNIVNEIAGSFTIDKNKHC